MKLEAATNTSSPSPLRAEPERGKTSLSGQHAGLAASRRKGPRNWETPSAPVPAPHLDDYQSIVGRAEIDELHFLASGLRGKTVKMVNSTAVGGESPRC